MATGHLLKLFPVWLCQQVGRQIYIYIIRLWQRTWIFSEDLLNNQRHAVDLSWIWPFQGIKSLFLTWFFTKEVTPWLSNQVHHPVLGSKLPLFPIFLWGEQSSTQFRRGVNIPIVRSSYILNVGFVCFPPSLDKLISAFHSTPPCPPPSLQPHLNREVNQAHQRSCIGKAGKGYDQGRGRLAHVGQVGERYKRWSGWS